MSWVWQRTMTWHDQADDGTRRYYLGEGRIIVMGDLNSDPNDGDSFVYTFVPDKGQPPVEGDAEKREVRPMDILLDSPQWLADPAQKSAGGVAASERDGGANKLHHTNPATDTADWDDREGQPGNLRVDYVLPSVDLEVRGGGVFWPTPDAPLMGVDLATVEAASDHRLVWVDVRLP